ncbi:Inositol-tetrakisphosphate 1-kinase [Galdieria sulphuraria]|nr:Inositol-tetrakisphosphate 1-kinase [Galdieria sulphuraria]
MSQKGKLVIGYSCNLKKRQSFFQPFGDYLARKGHILTELQLEDIYSLPHCDVVIHKRTDDMAAAFQGDTVASSRMVSLQNFLQSNNTTLIIDDMAAVWSVISRKGLLQKIDEIVAATQKYYSCTGHSTYSLKRLEWLQISNETSCFQSVSFPIILKSLPACGVNKSHRMYIVKNERALEEVLNTYFAKNEVVIAQRLVPSSYIWKVYVIGDNVDIFCQPNLPLFHIQREVYKGQGWFCFDSQVSFAETNGIIYSPPEETLDSLRHFIEPLIPIVSHVLGLSLYGLDIIFDEVERHYCIVDINYFPSFRGVENCFDKIWMMIRKGRNREE